MFLVLMRAAFTLCLVLVMPGTSGQQKGNTDFANVKLRLNNSSDQLALSYKENGSWLPICGDNWNDPNSAVVCWQLGMSYDSFSTVPSNFVRFSPYSWYCSGFEEDISECLRVTGFSACSKRWFVVLTCKDDVPAPAGSVLVTDSLEEDGKDSSQHGFLVMTEYNNIKWAICTNDNFSIDLLVRMLSVTCTQLGFTSVGTFDLVSKTTLPAPSKRAKCLPIFWLCSGSEESLSGCDWTMAIDVTWRLYAECSNSEKPDDGDVRLVGGNQFSGYIEVFYNSTWGRFCHYADSHTLQKTVCTQLQLGPPVDKHFTYSNRHFGRIHDICFDCHGQESELTQCQKYHNSFPCSLHQLVFVTCLPPVKTLPIRLVYEEERKNSLAKVQIQLANVWSDVIGGPNWGLKETMVICRMLNHGLPVPPVRYESRLITSSKQSVKLRPSCKGYEGSLLDCSNRISQGGTTTHEVIFVQCAPVSDAEDCDVALVDQSPMSDEKFVFLFHDNRWRPLCGDSHVWNKSGALTVCKHQGLAVCDALASTETFLGLYGMPISPKCSGFLERPSEYKMSGSKRQPCSKMAMVSCRSSNTIYVEQSYNTRGFWIYVSVTFASLLISVMFAVFKVWHMKKTRFLTRMRNLSTPSISEDSPATFALSSSSVKYTNDPPPSYYEFTANPHAYPFPSTENGHALSEDPPAYPGCASSRDQGNSEIEQTYV